MSTPAVKIVLDTNVFIAIIGKTSPFRWIFDAIINGRFMLCISKEILLEYEEILEQKTTSEIAENIANFLSIYPNVLKTEIYYNWQLITEDEDDNKFIDCAVSAGAFCIVSNDKHFKPFKDFEYPPLQILSLKEFESIFK